MSDFDSSLPIKSIQDLEERVLVKIQDGEDASGVDKSAEVSEKKLHIRAFGQDENDNDVQLRLNDNGSVTIANSDGQPIDENAPLAVYVAESRAEEVDEYDRAVDVAKNANSNHDYTVTAGKQFKFSEIQCSASGKARFELQIETGVGTGVFESKAVGFNSTANPNLVLKYTKNIAAGLVVRVMKTNLDNQAQDLYSQIQGRES
jgi:hypothetical protein